MSSRILGILQLTTIAGAAGLLVVGCVRLLTAENAADAMHRRTLERCRAAGGVPVQTADAARIECVAPVAQPAPQRQRLLL